jgi:hypothetical protein
VSQPWHNRRKSVKRYNEQLYIPVRDRRVFDDDPVHGSKRIAMLFRGNLKRLSLRKISKGAPWELFCRGCMMLDEFYSHDGAQIAFRDSVVGMAHICASLSEHPTRLEVLNSALDVEEITGVIYRPFMIGWMALVHLVQGDAFDVQRLFPDHPELDYMVSRCFLSFDKLNTTQYTDSWVFDLNADKQFKDR